MTGRASARRKQVQLSDFTCIQESHPYGVFPNGNRFFVDNRSFRRREEIFDDKLWQQILGFCDGATLGRLVQVSRYLYVIGHQPELWRDLVLRKCDTDNAIICKMKRSWKDTYELLFHNGDVKKYRTRPMKISGIYSDDIYQSHLCRSFAIPADWLEGTKELNGCTKEIVSGKSPNGQVPVELVDELTPEKFISKYEKCNQPVVVRGAGKGKAVDRWNDWTYLHQHNASSKTFRATSGAAPLPGKFSLKAYQEYTTFDYLEESPLYLFDRNAFTANKRWEKDFFPEFYRNCPYWDPSAEYGHDLLQHLGDKERPDHTWLIMGPKRSGSVFHIDPNATHAWNACIQGRKRWIFYPPGDPPPGVLPSADGDEVALPLSVGEWIVQYWTEHIEQYHERPAGRRPMECTTHPGDVIFVPHGWWHCVINLDEINIAITHNYVSPSNLGNVLKFFSEKQEQISGCRDRSESIKPGHIYDRFVEILQEKESHYLIKALTQKGWTCRAWDSRSDSCMTNGCGDNFIVNKDEIRGNAEKRNSKDSGLYEAFGNKRQRHTATENVSSGDISRKSGDSIATQQEERTSVMTKTDRLKDFSFSFL